MVDLTNMISSQNCTYCVQCTECSIVHCITACTYANILLSSEPCLYVMCVFEREVCTSERMSMCGAAGFPVGASSKKAL